jgi:hypothetical protein
MTQIISRAEAKALGLMHYYTGEPCKHNHLSTRYVSNRECYECTRERLATQHRKDYVKAWDQTPSGKISRLSNRLRPYGITPDIYNNMLKQQQNRCAICDDEFLFENMITSPCVDHDHVLNIVRGLLCSPCNLLIGLAKERIAILLNAADYLRSSNAA